MKLKNLFVLICFTFAVTLTYSQNTNQPATLKPDTSKSQKKIVEPSRGGENQKMDIQLKEEKELQKESPTKSKSEHVPGAEILIEQSPNDINNVQSTQPANPVVPAEKDKKKKPDK